MDVAPRAAIKKKGKPRGNGVLTWQRRGNGANLKKGDKHAVRGQVQGTYAIIPIKTNLCRCLIRVKNVTTLP